MPFTSSESWPIQHQCGSFFGGSGGYIAGGISGHWTALCLQRAQEGTCPFQKMPSPVRPSWGSLGAFSGGSCHDYVHPSFWRCLSPLCLCVSPCVFCLGVHLIQRPLPLFMSCLSRLPLCLLLSAVPTLTLFLFLIFTLFSFSLSHVHSPTLSLFLYWLLLSLTSSPLPFSQAGSLSSALPCRPPWESSWGGKGFQKFTNHAGPQGPSDLGQALAFLS